MKQLAVFAVLLALHFRPIAATSALHFGPADFRIFNPMGVPIGHSRYQLSAGADGLIIGRGEAHFDNGDYDIEADRLQSEGPGQLPRMLTLSHTFYRADGTLERAEKGDFRTGRFSCMRRQGGKVQSTTALFQLPSDAYGGSAVILPLQQYLAEGGRKPLNSYAINCIPGPRLIAAKAYVRKPAVWPRYPGITVEVDFKPDLGWLNLVVGPFLPELRAWFAPTQDWLLVGAEFSRYYHGPQLILVRELPVSHNHASPPTPRSRRLPTPPGSA